MDVLEMCDVKGTRNNFLRIVSKYTRVAKHRASLGISPDIVNIVGVCESFSS